MPETAERQHRTEAADSMEMLVVGGVARRFPPFRVVIPAVVRTHLQAQAPPAILLSDSRSFLNSSFALCPIWANKCQTKQPE